MASHSFSMACEVRSSGKSFLAHAAPGNGRDAPLIFVFHLIAVRLDDGVKLLLGLHQLFLIDALEAVGILGDQIDAAGKHVHIVLPARFGVVGQRGKRGQALIADVQLLERLIAPVHDDLLGLQLVAFLNDHLDEFRLVKLGVNKDLLALLDIDARLCNQLGIFSENCLFHKNTPCVEFQAFIIAHFSGFEKKAEKKYCAGRKTRGCRKRRDVVW